MRRWQWLYHGSVRISFPSSFPSCFLLPSSFPLLLHPCSIIKDEENLENWYYNPIRSPILSKSIRDIVPRMQQLLITPDQIPNSSLVNFNSVRMRFISFLPSPSPLPNFLFFLTIIQEKTIESIWFGFDRFGYLRFCKEQQFPKENIPFEHFNLTDGVTKIFLVTITNFNEGDSFQITTDDQTLTYPVIHSNIQVVCGFYTHEVNATIPFPVRMHDDTAFCIPFLAPISGDPSQSHILRELREKYVPFSANTVSITSMTPSTPFLLSSCIPDQPHSFFFVRTQSSAEITSLSQQLKERLPRKRIPSRQQYQSPSIK